MHLFLRVGLDLYFFHLLKRYLIFDAIISHLINDGFVLFDFLFELFLFVEIFPLKLFLIFSQHTF